MLKNLTQDERFYDWDTVEKYAIALVLKHKLRIYEYLFRTTDIAHLGERTRKNLHHCKHNDEFPTDLHKLMKEQELREEKVEEANRLKEEQELKQDPI